MPTKRIIPCLDIREGRTVKGIHFENIKDAGDPAEMAAWYSSQGADELVLLDITATVEKRKTFYDLVDRLSSKISIPFTVGGGISELSDISRLLQSGASKVSINTAAFKNPSLIKEAAESFGSGRIVLAVDVKQEADGEWYVYLSGGQVGTGKKAIGWAKEAVALGAGEVLLTSMSHDGTKKGFALDITARFSEELSVPVVASGGAGSEKDFLDAFVIGKADAALGASVFHFREIEIPHLKNYLAENNIPVCL